MHVNEVIFAVRICFLRILLRVYLGSINIHRLNWKEFIDRITVSVPLAFAKFLSKIKEIF